MIKIILIPLFLTACAYAVPEERDDNVNDKGFTFPHLTFPKFPNFPNFPPIPDIPAIPYFGNFQMPSFKIPEMKFPGPEDITKHKESDYTGMSVTQNSDGTRTIITNIGGVITRVTEKVKEAAIEKSKEDLKKST